MTGVYWYRAVCSRTLFIFEKISDFSLQSESNPGLVAPIARYHFTSCATMVHELWNVGGKGQKRVSDLCCPSQLATWHKLACWDRYLPSIRSVSQVVAQKLTNMRWANSRCKSVSSITSVSPWLPRKWPKHWRCNQHSCSPRSSCLCGCYKRTSL